MPQPVPSSTTRFPRQVLGGSVWMYLASTTPESHIVPPVHVLRSGFHSSYTRRLSAASAAEACTAFALVTITSCLPPTVMVWLLS